MRRAAGHAAWWTDAGSAADFVAVVNGASAAKLGRDARAFEQRRQMNGNRPALSADDLPARPIDERQILFQ